MLGSLLERVFDKEPLKALFVLTNFPVLVLMLLVVISGLAVSYVSYKNRLLHNAIQQEQVNRNNAQVEWGQLLLEHSTLTSPAYIEKIARERLNMDMPQTKDIEMVLP